MASSTRTTIIASFLLLLFKLSNAAQINVLNKCPYTVWAAAVPGGGEHLDPGQSWTVTANPGTTRARVWARTGCRFDANGKGHCQTGDCSGRLQCQVHGTPPNTLAEYSLNYQNKNLDFYDISLVDGFNVPMEFSPTAGCFNIRCTADIVGQCPGPLRTNGGCHNPCTVFKTANYCCNSGSCGPTDYSRFFKGQCPNAYSYPRDDPTSLTTCPGGGNYNVVFCP